MWGSYDPTESGLSEPKKGGLYWCSVKKTDFLAKNAVFWPEINFLETSSKFFDAIMAGHQKDNFFVLTASHGGPRGGRRGPFLARKSSFFYATPI